MSKKLNPSAKPFNMKGKQKSYDTNLDSSSSSNKKHKLISVPDTALVLSKPFNLEPSIPINPEVDPNDFGIQFSSSYTLEDFWREFKTGQSQFYKEKFITLKYRKNLMGESSLKKIPERVYYDMQILESSHHVYSDLDQDNPKTYEYISDGNKGYLATHAKLQFTPFEDMLGIVDPVLFDTMQKKYSFFAVRKILLEFVPLIGHLNLNLFADRQYGIYRDPDYNYCHSDGMVDWDPEKFFYLPLAQSPRLTIDPHIQSDGPFHQDYYSTVSKWTKRYPLAGFGIYVDEIETNEPKNTVLEIIQVNVKIVFQYAN